MSDERREAEDAAESEVTSARRPSPSSRARRIGGRPAAGPRPSPSGNGTVALDKRADTDAPAAPAPKPTPSATPKTSSTATPKARPTVHPVGSDSDGGSDDDADGARSRRSVPMAWIPAGVLGLAAAVLVVLIVIASHGVYWARPDTSASARAARQQTALAAAKQCFAQINSYDYRKLDGLVDRDLLCTTGKFTTDLKKYLTGTIIPLIPKLKATQTAQVNRAGIASVSADGSQVVVLIFGQFAQTNNSTAKNSPRIDVVGAVVTVDHVGGKWLVSKVDTDTGTGLSS